MIYVFNTLLNENMDMASEFHKLGAFTKNALSSEDLIRVAYEALQV